MVALLLVIIEGPAFAAPPRRSADAQEAAAVATQDEAATHFRRGVELYRDEDFAGALVEFRRAYELAPHHGVLYNIGQVSYLLHDYVAARDALSRYLRDGAGTISGRRRREVEAELARLERRIGRLEISVDREAAIFIDEVEVGRSPLPAPVPVNVGPRRVRVVAPDGAALAERVEVAGGTVAGVRFTLPLAQPEAKPVEARRPPARDPAPEALAPVLPQPRSGAPVQGAAKGVYIGWAATGLLAVGAGVAGAIALDARRKRDQLSRTFPADAERLEAERRRLRQAATTADFLLVASGLAAVATLVVPLFRQSGVESERSRAPRVGLRLAPGHVGLGLEGHY